MQFYNTITIRSNVVFLDWLAAAFMVLVLALLPGKYAGVWEHGKTFVASIVLVIMAFLLFKKENKIDINWFTTVIFCLFLLSLLSGLWAINPSLAFRGAGTWLFLLLLSLVTQMYAKQGVNIKFIIKAISSIYLANFIILLLALLYANFIDAPEETFYKNIRKLGRYFSLNGNYISSMMVMFYPMVFFVKQTVFSSKALKWLVAVIVAATIVLLNSRAATLAFIIVWIIFALKHLKAVNFKRALITLSLLVAMAIVLPIVDHSFWKMYNPFFGLNGGNDRLILWENTWLLAQQNLWWGHGAGNWLIVYPQTDIGALNSIIDRFNYYVHPHNFYIHLLSEIGLIGLLLFMALVIVTFIKLAAKKILFRCYALILVALVFLIVSFFYGITYSLNVNIPATQIGFIVALSTLSLLGEKTTVTVSAKLASLALIPLSIIIFIWFSYTGYNNATYAYVRINKKKLTSKAAGHIAKELYNKKFFTVFDSKSTLQLEINYLIKSKQYDKALKLLKIALEDYPTNPELHYSKGLCFRKIGDLDAASTAFETSTKFHSSLYRSYFQLAVIAAKEGDVDQFYEWKSKLSGVYVNMSYLEAEDDLELNEKANRYYKTFNHYVKQIDKLEQELLTTQKNR